MKVKKLEKKLTRHYKKLGRALNPPPMTLPAPNGSPSSRPRPARPHSFASAAAFALYGVGIVSMILLFVVVGGIGLDLLGLNPSGEQPNNSNPFLVPSGTSDPEIPDEMELNLSGGFVDEVITDYNVDREHWSLDYFRGLLDRFPASAIAIIRLSSIVEKAPTDTPSVPAQCYASFRLIRILEEGTDFPYSENDYLTKGTTPEEWYFGQDSIWHVRHYAFDIPLTDPDGYYIVWMNGENVLAPLTSNLNGDHAWLAWELYTPDTVETEQECLTAYAEQIAEVMPSGDSNTDVRYAHLEDWYDLSSDRGVEEFLAQLAEEYGDDTILNAECYNITNDLVREKTGVEIFYVVSTPGSLHQGLCGYYFQKEGKIFFSNGGYGYEYDSVLPCDFDGDGNYEFLTSQIIGSGVCCASIGILYPESGETKFLSYSYYSSRFIITPDEPFDGQNFTVWNWTFKNDLYYEVGRITAENGQPKVEIDENLKYDPPLGGSTDDPYLPDGAELNLSLGFEDEVITDDNVDREFWSLAHSRELLERFPDSAIAIIRLAAIEEKSPPITQVPPIRIEKKK